MNLASQVKAFIEKSAAVPRGASDDRFNTLALALFAAQFENVPVYRRFCEGRKMTPTSARRWTQIPALPTAAFKEFEVSSIPPAGRTTVFHSSGTTRQARSRHFHHEESLAIYEASLLAWFERNFQPAPLVKLIFLTPEDAPNSSLAHMFRVIRRRLAGPDSAFVGRLNADDSWSIDIAETLAALQGSQPMGLLGTAFSFVHLLDYLDSAGRRISLVPGSRVMETGGYKGRSREVPKPLLHEMISKSLGVAPADIVTEYGMSELGSQAYDLGGGFRFPPWARARVVSPETGMEAGDGETGLLQVFDLANIWSVMAVQTEDLAARRGDGFHLLGRAEKSEPRGCSLMPE